MRTVLALEPDPRQAAALKLVVSNRVGAQFVLAESKDAALSAIRSAVPDLILLTALISPRDETEIADLIRELDGAEHTQTLTIPLLDLGTARARQEEEARVVERVDRRGRYAGGALGMRPGGVCRRGRQLPAAGRTRQDRGRADSRAAREKAEAQEARRHGRRVAADRGRVGVERLLGVGRAADGARAGCGGDACRSSRPPSRSCTPSRSRRARPRTRRSPQGHRAGTTRGVSRRRRTPTSTTTSFPDPIPSSRRRQRRSRRCWTGR